MNERYQIIIPDLNATEWIDLVEIKLNGEIRNAEYILKGIESGELKLDKKEAENVLNLANEVLGNYHHEDTTPAIEIGFIPPRKYSALQSRYLELLKTIDLKNISPEEDDRFNDLIREYVRWGVKGHKNLGVDFQKEEERVGPLSYPVASWHMVDIYESIGMLVAIFHEILKYNTLSESKKKRSSLQSGMTPQPSIVKSAENGQT